MYSKQEISLTRQQFWTAFGQYLSPIPSAEGEKLNWVNYKTSVKHIRFIMEIENTTATIAIELSHPEKAERENARSKLDSLQADLEAVMGEHWQWQIQAEKDGRITDRFYTTLSPVNMMERSDWPALISFFKPRIIALDRFWTDSRFIFEM